MRFRKKPISSRRQKNFLSRFTGRGDGGLTTGSPLAIECLEERRVLVVTSIVQVEPDDSIAQAQPTGLTSGNTVTTSGVIGDGAFGGTTGDFDWFSVFVRPGQTLTAQTFADVNGSSLDSIIGIFNSAGVLLAFNDDSNLTLDSLIAFQPPVAATYYVAVGQWIGAAAFLSNSFNGATGPGAIAATQGPYDLDLSLTPRVNRPPVAVTDVFSAQKNIPIQIGVLANDSDSDGLLNVSSVTIVTRPTHGTVTVNPANGVVNYQPALNYVGPDSFTYTVKDDEGATSNVATVNLTVNPFNTPPIAANDPAPAFRNTPLAIDVLANDRDLDGTLVPASEKILSGPAHGTLAVNATTGVVTYTPALNYIGLDSFTYTVDDNGGATSNVATVSINVRPIPPIANPDSATTNTGVPITVNVLANDTAAAGLTINATSVNFFLRPSHGTATINRVTGAITYTPAPGYVGRDSLIYAVADNLGTLSNAASLTLIVNAPHNNPVVVNDTVVTPVGTAIAIAPLFNDHGVDAPIDPTSLVIVTGPGSGTAAVSSGGIITYTPVAGFSGSVIFTYRVKDTAGFFSNLGAITVIVDKPPVAVADSATTLEDTPVTIAVVTNDTDADGTVDPTRVAISTPPANGTVTVDPATGDVTYMPSANYNGSDTFQYTVRDNYGVLSAPATVTIAITPVNDPPVAVTDAVFTAANTAVTVAVAANDTDVDGTPIATTVAVATSPHFGTISVNAAGAITYTPNAGFIGGDSFTYTIKDDLGLISSPGSVLIRVGNAVSLAGFAYVDTNNNGAKDPGEIGISGVTITTTYTNGPVSFSFNTTTGADGSYTFTDAPAAGTVLPAGTYALTETQPGFYADGRATVGSPTGATASANAISGISLPQNAAATNFNFGELGLKAQFVATALGRAQMFASATPTGPAINLARGDAWFSFDGGASGAVTARALFDPSAGSVSLSLFDSGLNPLTSTAAGSGATLQYAGVPGAPYYLKVSGTNTSVNLLTGILSGPAVVWSNAVNAGDVNGDNIVAPLDALLVINRLNSRGAGELPLIAASAGTPMSFIDVNGDGFLSPIDALLVINQFNAAVGGKTLASSTVVSQAVSSKAVGVDSNAIDAALAQAGAKTSAAPLSASDNGVSSSSSSQDVPAASDTPDASQTPATALALSQAADAAFGSFGQNDDDANLKVHLTPLG